MVKTIEYLSLSTSADLDTGSATVIFSKYL